MRQQASLKKSRGSRFRLFGETISELRKVVWPTRREATYLTSIVIVVTVIVALVLWLIDYGFSELIGFILFE
ncbi:MAG: preprotein translocase subunit SecE [Dehalococcoidia bacterium]